MGRNDVLEGTVKWFNTSKGYGFIGVQGRPDVFVHFTGIAGDGYRNLKDGDHVQFIVVKGDKGPQASDVRVLES